MKTAHAGLGITEKEWEANMKYIADALDKSKVPEKEKEEVLFLSVHLLYYQTALNHLDSQDTWETPAASKKDNLLPEQVWIQDNVLSRKKKPIWNPDFPGHSFYSIPEPVYIYTNISRINYISSNN